MTGRMRVEAGKFLIEHYETENDDVVSYFSEIAPENLEELFETSLNVGVVALKTIGTTEKIDYIEKEFNRLQQKFDAILDKTVTDMATHIEETFGEKGTFSELIDQHFGEEGKLIKLIFDPTKEGTPLHQLRTLITEEIGRLGKELGVKEAVEEVKAVTTLKGFEFEDVCENFLGEIVKMHMGDELERTTTVPGRLSGSKKGDFVITLGERPDCRIVLETKDRQTVSLPEIHRTMKESLENRDAKYGIFVTKWIESLPKSVGCFNEYHKKYLVCALSSKEHEETMQSEILNIAVCWARIRSLMEEAKAEGLDTSLIQIKLEAIQIQVDSFSRIKRECTNVEKAVTKIRTLSDEIQNEINTHLDIIRESIVKVIDAN